MNIATLAMTCPPKSKNVARLLDESSSVRQSPKAILVDFQRPNLRFERGPRDAELGRSPLGSEYPAAAFFQGGLNHVLLLRQEFSGSSLRPFGSVRDGCFGNQLSSIEKISVSHSMTERSMTFCSSRMFPGQG